MTYAQAAALTQPQLMHALGERETRPRDLDRIVFERQRRVLDRICRRLRKWPAELLAMPAEDLAAQIGVETDGRAPATPLVATVVKRYVAHERNERYL